MLARAAGLLAAIGVTATVVASAISGWALIGIVPPKFAAAAAGTTSHGGAPLAPDLWAQLITTRHSGSLMDLLFTAGIASAVIGVLVLLFDRRNTRRSWLLDLFRAAGAAPFTIYVLHVIAVAVIFYLALVTAPRSTEIPWWAFGTGAFALQLGGVLTIGVVLAATGRRGPLEAVTSGIVRRMAR